MASRRVLLLLVAVMLACVLLARSAGAEGGALAPAASGGFVFRCNPVTDKTCRAEGVGVDLDGDWEDDELPGFKPHLNILGHGH